MNVFIGDHGLHWPKTELGVWQPGFLGVVVVGGIAAVGSCATLNVLELVGPHAAALGLTNGDIANALITGFGGAKWFKSESGKDTLQKAAGIAASKAADHRAAVTIATEAHRNGQVVRARGAREGKQRGEDQQGLARPGHPLQLILRLFTQCLVPRLVPIRTQKRKQFPLRATERTRSTPLQTRRLDVEWQSCLQGGPIHRRKNENECRSEYLSCFSRSRLLDDSESRHIARRRGPL